MFIVIILLLPLSSLVFFMYLTFKLNDIQKILNCPEGELDKQTSEGDQEQIGKNFELP